MPDVALWPLQDRPRPEPPCDETVLINELIREYLCWHGLRDSLSVFIPGAHTGHKQTWTQALLQHRTDPYTCCPAETGQPAVRPFDREFMVRGRGQAEAERSMQRQRGALRHKQLLAHLWAALCLVRRPRS